ncbi:hypothetical protein D3C81_1912760 [compost metagenome]
MQQIGPVNIQADYYSSFIAFQQRPGPAADIQNAVGKFQLLQQNRQEVLHLNFPVHRLSSLKMIKICSSAHRSDKSAQHSLIAAVSPSGFRHNDIKMLDCAHSAMPPVGG